MDLVHTQKGGGTSGHMLPPYTQKGGGDFHAHIASSLNEVTVHGFISKATYKQLSY